MKQIFFGWLIPFLCGCGVSLVWFLFGLLRKERKEQDAIRGGLCSLLRAEIIRSYEKYAGRNFCPIYGKEALKKAYDSYHALGGNDVATKLFEKMMALPEEAPGRAAKERED